MCGMNAYGAQQHAGISILLYISLKIALLLHKTALVNFPMATTVPNVTGKAKLTISSKYLYVS